jgi:hypothetical protein
MQTYAFPCPATRRSCRSARPASRAAQLIDYGTLDKYLRTQYIDHVFILTVLVLHAAVLLWVSRLFPAGHRGRRLMVAAAMLSAAAPLSGTLENLISYVMLADPGGFADTLALAYSSLAALKFAAFTFADAALLVGLLAGAVVRWRDRRAGAVVGRPG